MYPYKNEAKRLYRAWGYIPKCRLPRRCKLLDLAECVEVIELEVLEISF